MSRPRGDGSTTGAPLRTGKPHRRAARTGGLNAYVLPGAGVWPAEKIVEILGRYNVFVAFDGDDAGRDGRDGKTITHDDGRVEVRERLVALLQRQGVNAVPRELWAGLDIADTLVARYASGSATGTPRPCGTCVRFRQDHADKFSA